MEGAMKRLVLGSLTLVLLLGFTAFAQEPKQDNLPIGLTSVQGPIAVTPSSHPFNASDMQNVAVDLSKFGYVEEEYFVSGRANVYEYGNNFSVQVKTAGAAYTTRILVRRPADPSRFSGTVIVEPFNPSFNFDLPIMWAYSHAYFLKHGDIYVGITIKAVSIRALKNFDPERYAALSMANPLPASRTCSSPGWTPFLSFPESEDGLAWDIISQVGLLLKSESPQNPVKNFRVQYLYATGQSQTGSYVNSYIRDFHPAAKLPNGRHIYDGFVVNSSGRLIPVNQCSTRLPLEDPHNVVHSDVPFIQTFTQTDVPDYALQRRPDSDAEGDFYRRYEIGGASHATTYEFQFFPTEAELNRAGVDPHTNEYRCAEPFPNDFPVEYLYSGAYANLDRWVRTKTPPPTAPPVTTVNGTAGQTMFVMDAYGNVLGGVRSVYLDVPTSTFVQSSWGTGCFTYFGHKIPFDHRRLHEMYPDHEAYLKQVDTTVERMLRDSWITSEDANEIKAQAATAEVP
jgi:hypothetical protein